VSDQDHDKWRARELIISAAAHGMRVELLKALDEYSFSWEEPRRITYVTTTRTALEDAIEMLAIADAGPMREQAARELRKMLGLVRDEDHGNESTPAG
jgi:hypothetical protein